MDSSAESLTQSWTGLKRTLVTGGAGFIGGHLVHLLHKLHVDTIVLDDLSTGRLENLPHDGEDCDFVRGDICDRDVLTRIIRDSDLVIHLASVVGTTQVSDNFLKTIQTNIHGVQLIAEVCSQFEVPLVYVSSSAVYRPQDGAGAIHCDESACVHAVGQHPASIYGDSKRLGELICDAYRRTRGLRYLILRPFNLIGPRQSAAYGMVVPTFIRYALDGQTLPIHGDGMQKRTFSDVRQAVDLMWSLVMRTRWDGQIFNLAANEEPISIMELADTVARAAGCAVSYRFIPYEDAFGQGYQDVQYRRPSTAKLRRLLGPWKPIPLESTIRDICSHHRSQRVSSVKVTWEVQHASADDALPVPGHGNPNTGRDEALGSARHQ